MTRKLVSLEPLTTPPSEESVRALADELFEQAMADGSESAAVLSAMRNVDMIDVLRDELKEYPESPVSREIKRVVRERSLNRARSLARRILRTD